MDARREAPDTIERRAVPLDAPQEVARRIGEVLTSRQSTVAVAESLTGGLLVQALARVEGSGEWLAGGVVAYATSVKRRVLGVVAPKVVSHEAAVQLAAGARRALGADVAVSVTGVAGPASQDGEPAGTVWIGVDDGCRAEGTLLSTGGSPGEVCDDAVAAALQLLLQALEDR